MGENISIKEGVDSINKIIKLWENLNKEKDDKLAIFREKLPDEVVFSDKTETQKKEIYQYAVINSGNMGKFYDGVLYDAENETIKNYVNCGKKLIQNIICDAYRILKGEDISNRVNNVLDFKNLATYQKINITPVSSDRKEYTKEFDSNSKSHPGFNDYAWAHWSSEMWGVAVFLERKKEDECDNSDAGGEGDTNCFEFSVKIHITVGRLGSSSEEKLERLRSIEKIEKEIKEKIEDSVAFYPQQIDVEKNEPIEIYFPKVKINLKEDSEYDVVVNELVSALMLFESIQAYIDTNDKSKLAIVEENAKLLQVAKEYNISLSNTLISINDLIQSGCRQLVLTGAPGTGKTYSAKEYVKWMLLKDWKEAGRNTEDYEDEWKKNWEEQDSIIKDRYAMVQFHPSYDYTDFVEGLRPAKVNGKTTFVRMDGTFKAFCRNAVKKPDKQHYFIIDEVNRADLSKVFGELMYCLEEGYRGEANAIKTQYSNLPTYVMQGDEAVSMELINSAEKNTDVYKHRFYIPENVVIIGTMNDIDRSVDTFDFALRRRFRWVNVKANEIMKETFYEMNKKADRKVKNVTSYAERVEAMNKVFDGYDAIFKTAEDYYIGPAYFKGLFGGDTMESIWANKVEPLLKEYVRGRKEAKDFIDKCKKELLSCEQENEGNVEDEIDKLLKLPDVEVLTSEYREKWARLSIELEKNKKDIGINKSTQSEKIMKSFLDLIKKDLDESMDDSVYNALNDAEVTKNQKFYSDSDEVKKTIKGIIKSVTSNKEKQESSSNPVVTD